MLDVLTSSIFPIFSIILLGYLLKVRGIISPEFVRPANQLVFYVAIPAILFNAITQAPLKANLDVIAGFCLLGALGSVFFISLFLSRVLKISDDRRGTFLQSSFHGNIGYMAYAIAYYALGGQSFAQTAILSSFILVGQNFAAVWALTATNQTSGFHGSRWSTLKHTVQNPVILAVVAALTYSVTGLPVPKGIRQSLTIISGMAVPTALLLIGASLSFGAFRSMGKEIIGIGSLKLVCLPLIGYFLMTAAGVPKHLLLPGIILLASPPATVTYVMAIELGGNPELAAASISILTMFSALTYSVYISALMQ